MYHLLDVGLTQKINLRSFQFYSWRTGTFTGRMLGRWHPWPLSVLFRSIERIQGHIRNCKYNPAAYFISNSPVEHENMVPQWTSWYRQNPESTSNSLALVVVQKWPCCTCWMQKVQKQCRKFHKSGKRGLEDRITSQYFFSFSFKWCSQITFHQFSYFVRTWVLWQTDEMWNSLWLQQCQFFSPFYIQALQKLCFLVLFLNQGH